MGCGLVEGASPSVRTFLFSKTNPLDEDSTLPRLETRREIEAQTFA
jgi:hypothetical protein